MTLWPGQRIRPASRRPATAPTAAASPAGTQRGALNGPGATDQASARVSGGDWGLAAMVSRMPFRVGLGLLSRLLLRLRQVRPGFRFLRRQGLPRPPMPALSAGSSSFAGLMRPSMKVRSTVMMSGRILRMRSAGIVSTGTIHRYAQASLPQRFQRPVESIPLDYISPAGQFDDHPVQGLTPSSKAS